MSLDDPAITILVYGAEITALLLLGLLVCRVVVNYRQSKCLPASNPAEKNTQRASSALANDVDAMLSDAISEAALFASLNQTHDLDGSSESSSATQTVVKDQIDASGNPLDGYIGAFFGPAPERGGES